MYPKVLCARCCGLGAGWAPWHVIAQSGPGDYAYMWGAGTRGWWETCRGAWWPAGQCRSAVCCVLGECWGWWCGRLRAGLRTLGGEGQRGECWDQIHQLDRGGWRQKHEEDISWKPFSHYQDFPESKVHGANMGPSWGRQDPSGPHVGHMKLAIWELVGKIYSVTQDH